LSGNGGGIYVTGIKQKSMTLQESDEWSFSDDQRCDDGHAPGRSDRLYCVLLNAAASKLGKLDSVDVKKKATLWAAFSIAWW